MSTLSNPISGKTLAVRRHLTHNAAAWVVLVLLFVLLGVGTFISDRFSTVGNLLNVHQQATGLALVSLGQTLAVLTGGIDLSVGSIISVAATLTSGLADNPYGGWPTAVIAVILLSAVIGLVNGCLILWLKVHPLIVTLGMGAVLQGGILYYSLGPAGSVPDGFDSVAYGRFLNIPATATIVVLLFFAASFLMRKTLFGHYIYMVGDDNHAAALTGVPTKRVILFVYVFSGICAGLTGIYLAAQFGSGQPYLGVNYTLASITPVVVGGTVLTGGRGGVIGTLIAAYLLSLLNNLINFAGVPSQYQLIVQGLAVIIAVSVNTQRKRVTA